jgi:hypothetical protein
MATKGVYFNGKQLTIPGLYATIDSTMNSSKTAAGATVIGLIGECTGGEPGKVQFFSDPSVARKILKGGELLTAMNKAWNPVSGTKSGLTLGGADVIACIRANRATKANTAVKIGEVINGKIGEVVSTQDTDSTGILTATGEYVGYNDTTIRVEVVSVGETALNATKINYTYEDASEFVWDTPVNASTTPIALGDTGVSVSLSDGIYHNGDKFVIPVKAAVPSDTVLYNVQSKDWGIGVNKIQHKIENGSMEQSKKFVVYNTKSDTYETFDNLGPVFSIQYNGDQPYAAMTITNDGEGNSVSLKTYIGADKESAILDLNIDLDTTAFNTIKKLVNYLTGYENYTFTFVRGYNTAIMVNDLDFVEDVSIKNKCIITAYLRDLQKTVEENSELVTITDVKRDIQNELPDYDYVNLVGGSEGTIPQSWADYYEKMAAYRIDYVVPLTDSMTIIAEGQAHVNNLSNNFGRERRMVCGGGNHLSVDDAVVAATKIADPRVQYVYPGFYDTNENGDTELYPAYILAAALAGRFAHLPEGDSATHDTFRMTAIEKALDPTSIKILLNSGVLTFEAVISEDSFSTDTVRCVQDITTYTSDNNTLYVERAVGQTADNINRRIRDSIDNMIVGRKTNVGILTSVKNAVLSVLKNTMKEPYESIIAYKNVKVYKNNGNTYIEYAAAPAEPTNFVLITGHFYSEDLDVSDSNTDE